MLITDNKAKNGLKTPFLRKNRINLFTTQIHYLFIMSFWGYEKSNNFCSKDIYNCFPAAFFTFKVMGFATKSSVKAN